MTRKYSKPISLYPLSLDNSLRAALQTPLEKRRAVRAAMRIPKDKIDIFKEEVEDKAEPKPKEKLG